MSGEGYRLKALRKLNTDYARRSWNNTGYFGVPGATMRELVGEGYAEMRKRGPSDPAEYRSRTLLAKGDPALWFAPVS